MLLGSLETFIGLNNLGKKRPLSLLTDKAAGLQLSESYCRFSFSVLIPARNMKILRQAGQKISGWTRVLIVPFEMWLQPIMGSP